MKSPKFYDWGGGGLPYTWSFGWLTGKDNDLVCVLPEVKTHEDGEVSLSPVCSNRLSALIAFVCKFMLLRLDHNIRFRRCFYDNPNTRFGNH